MYRIFGVNMIDIIYGSNKNIDINDEPELIVIKEH